MHLTQCTDYSLRLLMVLGLRQGDSMTLREVSELYGISRNHLVKVVRGLSALGVVETIRGRNGGVRLAVPLENVSVGKVVRAVEPSLNLAECFASEDRCLITTGCGFRPVLAKALEAFFEVLDEYCLADLLATPGGLPGIFAKRDETWSALGSSLSSTGNGNGRGGNGHAAEAAPEPKSPDVLH